jgi:hypothetical protein
MAHAKPTASISLDLDNQWSYMRTHGDAGWESYPSYLSHVLPLALTTLAAQRLKATVFLVGRDAEQERHRELLGQIPQQGHEVGNHSQNHLQWMHRLPRPELEREITLAEEAITTATGVRPRGFRGPGFACSTPLLQILAQRGYDYDCSTFPTFVGPLARAYYFMTARKLTQKETEERQDLFGDVRDGFRPLRSYLWTFGDARGDAGAPLPELLEIPVTTMPGVRTPIHMSYVLYLAQRSSFLALRYLETALRLCAATGIEPSILLHPLDFISGDTCSALRFFPAMAMPATYKRELVSRALALLAQRFDVVPMGEHARRLRAAGSLPRRTPDLSH